MKRILFAILAAMLSISMMACGNTSSPAPSTSPAASDGSAQKSGGKININGSTSVQPLAEALGKAFTTKSGVLIDVQGTGSSAGIKAITEGTTDIGTSSRDLKDEEKTGLTQHIIALDGIAVVVSPKNTVSSLTKEQIVDIFSGKITNWKEVGGSDKSIAVISREEGSGTRSAFEEIMKLTKKEGDKEVSLVDDANPIIADGNGAVKSNISGKDNAIGYLSLGVVDSNVKALPVDGVSPSEATVKDKTYKVQRPLLMLTKGTESDNIKTFLEFIKSDEGSKIITEKGYVVAN